MRKMTYRQSMKTWQHVMCSRAVTSRQQAVLCP